MDSISTTASKNLQYVEEHGYDVGINDECTNTVIVKIELAVFAFTTHNKLSIIHDEY